MNFRMMLLVFLGFLGGFCLSLDYVGPAVAADALPPRLQTAKNLPAVCRAAKAQYRPLGPKEVAESRQVLAEAVNRLEHRLALAGPVGERWRRFLELPLLERQLHPAARPDPNVLRRILAHFNADGDGLELVWFLDVKEAMDNHLVTLAAAANPNQRLDFERKMDILAAALEPYAARPIAENAVLMGQGLHWLNRTQYAPPLARAIEAHFVRPNLFIEISAELMDAKIAEPTAETIPLRDCVLGTDIHGTSRTVGQTIAELSPHPTLGVFDAVFRGTTITENVGYHWPVTIYSTSTAKIASCKRIWFDANGLHSHPAVSNATTGIDLHDIDASGLARRLKEKIGWRHACKQLSEAECITSQHTIERLNKWVDLRAADPLQRANQAYYQYFQRPLLERKLFPQKLGFRTTRQAISIVVLHARGGKMAAPDAPPPVIAGADLSLRIHETMINNLACDILAGRILREEKLQASFLGTLVRLPEKSKSDKDGKPWAIAFSRRQPLTLTFADGGFKIALHGTYFRQGLLAYTEPMDISAIYKIQKTKNAFKVVRQGEIRVFPPGQPANAPAKGLLDMGRKVVEEQVVRVALQNQFAKVFVPEFSIQEFGLPDERKEAIKLRPAHADARDGWLVLAYQRVAGTR